MAETSSPNCGNYLKDVPRFNYEIYPGLEVLKQLVSDVTKAIGETIGETIGSISGTMSGLPYADEVYLNSAMSVFNNMYNINEGLTGELHEFFRNNLFLIPLVSEAYGKLYTYFPYDTASMYVDQNMLVISVGTNLSPKEAREKLRKFDNEWWLDVCTISQAKLCITVEFQ